MKRLFVVFTIISVGFGHIGFGQSIKCAVKKEDSPKSLKLLKGVRNSMADDTATYTFQLVFHILLPPQKETDLWLPPTDEQIKQSVGELNRKYRDLNLDAGVDTKLQFVLAGGERCIENFGIIRKDITQMPEYSEPYYTDPYALRRFSRADTTKYINVYITPLLPALQEFSFVYDSDIFMPLDHFYNITVLPHEMGHVFYLHHTFAGQGYDEATGEFTCPPNDNPETDGDMVSDTDPHTRFEYDPASLNPCTGRENGLVVYNPMSYNAHYWVGFTQKQSERMRQNIVAFRQSWINSHLPQLPAPVISYQTNKFCGIPTGLTLEASEGWDAYQWLKDGVEIPGATDRTYVVTQNGEYKVRVIKCPEENISAGFQVNQLGPLAIPQCNFVAIGGMSPSLGISNVTFNTINKSSATSYADGGNYIDFSCTDSTTVYNSATYPVSITPANNNGGYVNIYIDYNNNGDFTDAGELVYSKLSLVHEAQITIPAVTAPYMRMRVVFDIAPITSACRIEGRQGAGQAEDYRLRIGSCTSALVVNNTISGNQVLKAGSSITANNTINSGNVGYEAGQAIVLQNGFQVGNGSVFKAEIRACD